MDKQKAKKRMNELIDKINHYAHAYYVLDAPIIPDGEYDALFHELLALETEHPDLIDAHSLTKRVGAEPLDALEKIDKQKSKKIMNKLIDKINHYAHEYYVLDAPIIPDGEYDALFHELLALETEHPDLIDAHSPTKRVGAEPLDAFEKVTHEIPLLSLVDVVHE